MIQVFRPGYYQVVIISWQAVHCVWKPGWTALILPLFSPGTHSRAEVFTVCRGLGGFERINPNRLTIASLFFDNAVTHCEHQRMMISQNLTGAGQIFALTTGF